MEDVVSASTEEPPSKRLAEQIRVDVDRTMPDIALLHSSTENAGDNISRCGTNISERTAVSSVSSVEALGSLTWQADHLKKSLGDKVCSVLASASGNGAEKEVATHAEAMARILYVYARFNRGAGYVQGMNEILAPLYYVVAVSQQRIGGYSVGDCEADAFHMFLLALRGVHLDMFVSAMDSVLRTPPPHHQLPSPPSDILAASLMAGNASSYMAAMHSVQGNQNPATAKMARSMSPEVSTLLTGDTGGLQHTLRYWWVSCVRAADRRLWAALDGVGIQPEHFALRWLLVWGAREFALPDVLVLWDALMANRARLIAPQPPATAPAAMSADESLLDAADLLDRDVTRALQPMCSGTSAVIDAGLFRLVDFSAGKLACNVRVQQGISGDDDDGSELGFLFDFFTAVLLAVRDRLLNVCFEEGIAFLQNLPRHTPELQMPQLIAETVRIRQERAAMRVVRACRSVLASVATRRRSDSQAAKLAPLVAGTGSAGIPESLASITAPVSPELMSLPAVDAMDKVSKFFGQISDKFRFLQPGHGSAPTSPVLPLSPTSPTTASYDGRRAPAHLLLALPRTGSANQRLLHIYEVVDYSALSKTACVRKLAECDAKASSLVEIQRMAGSVDRRVVSVCLTPREVKRMVSSVGKGDGERLAAAGSGGMVGRRQGLPNLEIPNKAPVVERRAASSTSTVVAEPEPFWWASMEPEFAPAAARARVAIELCDFDSDEE
ncbi:hypothetical protein FBU59_000362 [Linderina macrospora]|uniref:Uncharacterized protein n=1 Tax=Linderina macrospora TaxID=4868 RepID=A0ACC1JHC5_9FUNG|nr:hypothetical protein FBU59_000362 [Linderina macrospora]